MDEGQEVASHLLTACGVWWCSPAVSDFWPLFALSFGNPPPLQALRRLRTAEFKPYVIFVKPRVPESRRRRSAATSPGGGDHGRVTVSPDFYFSQLELCEGFFSPTPGEQADFNKFQTSSYGHLISPPIPTCYIKFETCKLGIISPSQTIFGSKQMLVSPSMSMQDQTCKYDCNLQGTFNYNLINFINCAQGNYIFTPCCFFFFVFLLLTHSKHTNTHAATKSVLEAPSGSPIQVLLDWAALALIICKTWCCFHLQSWIVIVEQAVCLNVFDGLTGAAKSTVCLASSRIYVNVLLPSDVWQAFNLVRRWSVWSWMYRSPEGQDRIFFLF